VKAGPGECDCDQNELCLNEVCRKKCTSDDDCGRDESCTGYGEETKVCATAEGKYVELAAVAPQVKVDMLWIIDNSASMCQEQHALAKGFEQFVAGLQENLSLDVRIAVTNTDALSNQGELVNSPADGYPAACSESVVLACMGDSECTSQLGTGWQCDGPDKTQYLENKNGSVNSRCTRRCNTTLECCEEFCFANECGDDQSCIQQQCADSPDECDRTCVQVFDDYEHSGCQPVPDTKDCPASLPTVLANNTLEWFRCNATVGADQSYSANLEQGLAAAWMAVDPDGSNQAQATKLLRDDAYLMLVFVTDEDDCSIDEDFATLNWDCGDDSECPGKSDCRTDTALGKKVCHGTIKKDYYNICALLGEFQGVEHFKCARDLTCSDCQSDDDCPEGWHCKQIGSSATKCRPYIYSFNTITSLQSPAGTPLYALARVAKYYSRFKSLKSDPDKVLVAAITGDGIVQSSEVESLVSQECLADEKLAWCNEYNQVKATAPAACLENPYGEDCQEFAAARLACIRECYTASKGDGKSAHSKNTYVCNSSYGRADFGSRYVRLAQMFGSNGTTANICSAEGMGAALEQISKLLITRTTKVCLPYEPTPGTEVVVELITPSGETSVLSEGAAPDGDYEVQYPASDCCFPDEQGNCTGSQKAVLFHEVLPPDSTVGIAYVR